MQKVYFSTLLGLCLRFLPLLHCYLYRPYLKSFDIFLNFLPVLNPHKNRCLKNNSPFFSSQSVWKVRSTDVKFPRVDCIKPRIFRVSPLFRPHFGTQTSAFNRSRTLTKYRKTVKLRKWRGFSILLLLLLSDALYSRGGRYFRMAKPWHCTPYGHFENKIAKSVKGILFEKR